MKEFIDLYHGSSDIIRVPEFGKGRKHNDYGTGFYCTEDEDLAKEWACSSLGGGFSNYYRLDTRDLNILDMNSGEYTILNWMAVLVTHRIFRPDTPLAGRARRYLEENFYLNVEAYDVIKGYRADDAYYDFAQAFLNNGITVGQLSRAMTLGRLGEQIVLKSRRSFENLSFCGFSPADPDVYYPLRKARNDKAEEDFRRITEEDADGLYMIDIIRQKVTNDDARLQRIISE